MRHIPSTPKPLLRGRSLPRWRKRKGAGGAFAPVAWIAAVSANQPRLLLLAAGVAMAAPNAAALQ